MIVTQPNDVGSIEAGLRKAIDLMHPSSLTNRLLMLEEAYKIKNAYHPEAIIDLLEREYDFVVKGNDKQYLFNSFLRDG